MYVEVLRELGTLALADQYDALRSARPYRTGIKPREDVWKIIEDYTGPSEPLEALADLTRAL